MNKILEVVTNNDYILEVRLTNNHVILCDMKARLTGIRFNHLKDETKFRSFEISNGNTIKWSNNCELSLDEILMMLET